MKQNKARIIGVTGGIGSGKSAALEYVQNKYGFMVIRADDIGNEVKLRGRECFEPIVKLLGEDIIGDDGEIDKGKMASVIFGREDLLEAVNGIIHPAVRRVIDDLIATNQDRYECILIEAALLVEAGYNLILDEIWEVTTPTEIRIQRLCESRGYSVSKCEAIIARQHDDSYVKKQIDKYNLTSDKQIKYVRLVNDGEKEKMFKQIDKATEGLL